MTPRRKQSRGNKKIPLTQVEECQQHVSDPDFQCPLLPEASKQHQKDAQDAAATIAAAAGIAVSTVATAASVATKAVVEAAGHAQDVLATAAEKSRGELAESAQKTRSEMAAAAEKASAEMKLATVKVEGQVGVLDEKLDTLHILMTDVKTDVGALNTRVGIQNGRVYAMEAAVGKLKLVVYSVAGSVMLAAAGAGFSSFCAIMLPVKQCPYGVMRNIYACSPRH